MNKKYVIQYILIIIKYINRNKIEIKYIKIKYKK